MKDNPNLRDSKQITAIANVIVALGVVFFMTRTLDAFNYPKAVVVSTGVIALLFSLIVHKGYLLNFRNIHAIEFIIYGMAILTIVIASFNDVTSFITLWGSFSRANGLMAKVPLLILAAIYFRFSRKETISRFFDVALLLLIFEVVYGAIQLSGSDPIPWNNPYNNIFVTAGNPNFAAALFAILVALNIRHIFTAKTQMLRLFFLSIVIAGIYMSYATQSVQGILTIAAALFLLILIAIIRFVRSNKIRTASIGIAFLAALPIALGVFNVGPLKAYLFQETLSIRLHYWRIALKILGDHPWVGVGIDRYGDYYRTYREPWFVEKYGPGLISTNAHNVALQWGTDLGLLGLAMYLALFILPTFVYLKYGRLRIERKLQEQDFIYVGFFAFYLQSLISISQFSVTILGFALLGISLSYIHQDSNVESHKDSVKKSSRRNQVSKASFVGFGTWWLLFVAALAPFTSSIVRNDLNLRKAMELPGTTQQVSDLLPRSKAIEDAIKPFIEDQDYVSLAIQNLYTQGNAQTGIEIAKAAVLSNPRSWVGYQSQVLAYAQSNMTPEALEAAKKTLELDPLNYNIQFNLAEQALKSGDKILAKKYAQIAKESAPITTEAYIGAKRILAELGE